MHIERAHRWPAVPHWAIGVVSAYFALIGLYLSVVTATGSNPPPLCLFRRVTGYPCPTCGSTHMVLAIAQGRLREAAGYNPLMFALAILATILLVLRIGFRRRIIWITSVRSRRILASALVLAVLANWIYLLVRT